MSMYGDDENGIKKENLYCELENFLADHSVDELLRVVADVIEYSR